MPSSSAASLPPPSPAEEPWQTSDSRPVSPTMTAHISSWLTSVDRDPVGLEALKSLYSELSIACRVKIFLFKIENELTKLDGNVCITHEVMRLLIPPSIEEQLHEQMTGYMRRCCSRFVSEILFATEDLIMLSHASGMRARATTSAFAFQSELGPMISEICASSLIYGPETALLKRRCFLHALDLFENMAYEEEQAALNALKPELVKLRNTAKILTQMISKNRTAIQLTRFAHQNMSKLGCLLHRICCDPWFRFFYAARPTPVLHLVSTLLQMTMPTSDEGPEVTENIQDVATRFHELISSHGASFVDALAQDVVRVDEALQMDISDTRWRGVEATIYADGSPMPVDDEEPPTEASSSAQPSQPSSSTQPSQASKARAYSRAPLGAVIALQCPIFTPSWQTKTFKLYIYNTQTVEHRSLMVHRAAKILRAATKQGWLPVDALRVESFIQIVRQRHNAIAFNMTTTARNISHKLSTMGVIGMKIDGLIERAMRKAVTSQTEAERDELQRFQIDLKKAVSLLKDQQSENYFHVSETPNSTSVADMTLDEPTKMAVMRAVPWSTNYLHLSPGFDTSEEVYPHRVHPWVRLEYIFVTAIFKLLRGRILRAAESSDGNNSTRVETSMIASEAATYDARYAAMKITELSGRVTHICNKFITCFKSGYHASQKAVTEGIIHAYQLPEFTILSTQDQTIQFGIDTNDQLASLCAEAAFRIKAHFENLVPLPHGMTWQVSEPHRGSRSKKVM